MGELTPKQELFAQNVAAGMSQADAYRASRDASKMKDETIQQAASRLMADYKVSARVNELRKPIVEKVGLTLESHLTRLNELSVAAEEAGQFSAAISAEISRGKACGHYTEKAEIAHTMRELPASVEEFV